MTYKLQNFDAATFLDGLRASSVDLIVSSPPYFMGKEYDRSSSVEDFFADHVALLPRLVRALKPGGSLCWQVGNHVKDGAIVPLDALVTMSHA